MGNSDTVPRSRACSRIQGVGDRR
jgi:CheY-like chemotaxis protein